MEKQSHCGGGNAAAARSPLLLLALPDACLVHVMSFAVRDAVDLCDFAATCTAAKAFLCRNRREPNAISAAMKRTFAAGIAEFCAVDAAHQQRRNTCGLPPLPPAEVIEERQRTLIIPPGGVRSVHLAELMQTWAIHVTSIRVARFGCRCGGGGGDGDDGDGDDDLRQGDENLEFVVGGGTIVRVNRELARLVAEEPDGSVELMQFLKCLPPAAFHDMHLVYKSRGGAAPLVATVTALVSAETPLAEVVAPAPNNFQNWLIDCPTRADFHDVADDAPPEPAWVAGPPVAGLLTIPFMHYFPSVIQSFTVHAATGSMPPVRSFTLVLEGYGDYYEQPRFRSVPEVMRTAPLSGTSRSFLVPNYMVRRATMPSGGGAGGDVYYYYYQINLQQCISFSRFPQRVRVKLLVQFEDHHTAQAAAAPAAADPLKVVVGMATKRVLHLSGGCMFTSWYEDY